MGLRTEIAIRAVAGLFGALTLFVLLFNPIGHSTSYWTTLDKVFAIAAFFSILVGAVGWKRR
jgi:hypothetical protein